MKVNFDFTNPAHLGMAYTVMAIVTTNIWAYMKHWEYGIPAVLSWMGVFYCVAWVVRKKKKR